MPEILSFQYLWLFIVYGLVVLIIALATGDRMYS